MSIQSSLNQWLWIQPLCRQQGRSLDTVCTHCMHIHKSQSLWSSQTNWDVFRRLLAVSVKVFLNIRQNLQTQNIITVDVQLANNAQLFIFFSLFGSIGFTIRQSNNITTGGKSLQATQSRFVGKLLQVVPIKMMNSDFCLCKWVNQSTSVNRWLLSVLWFQLNLENKEQSIKVWRIYSWTAALLDVADSAVQMLRYSNNSSVCFRYLYQGCQ